jgi:hypothetical protein
MFTPTTQQLQIRFSNLPNHLQELIFDEKESDIIDGIGQESGFSLEKKEQLAHITLMVLTGFVSTTDIPKILMEALGIERVEAEKISGKLHDRIFTFVKNELAAVYKPEFSDDEIKKEEALEVTSSVSKETVSLENQESTPAFSLESLAPLELDLRQSTHPEAVQSTEKEPVTASTVPLPEPPKPVEAPVILHTESEIQPITFDLQDAELKAPELSIQNQSTEPEQATVQLGSAYIPTDTVPLPEPPKPEPEKNDLGIDKKNAVEFTPQLIKNAETVETIQTTTETNTGTDFIDLSTLTGDKTPEQQEIKEEQKIETAPNPEPEKNSEYSEIIKEQLPITDREKTNTESKNIFSHISTIFSGLTKLGEKPKPVENREIGPITTNAKIVDYTQPQTTQKEEKNSDNAVMIDTTNKEIAKK